MLFCPNSELLQPAWPFSALVFISPPNKCVVWYLFFSFRFFPCIRTSVRRLWAAPCCAATSWTGTRSKTCSCAFCIFWRACPRVRESVTSILYEKYIYVFNYRPRVNLFITFCLFRGSVCLLEQSSLLRADGLLHINRVSTEIERLRANISKSSRRWFSDWLCLSCRVCLHQFRYMGKRFIARYWINELILQLKVTQSNITEHRLINSRSFNRLLLVCSLIC